MRESKVIRSFTVPGTPVTIEIERVTLPAVAPARARRTTYVITRKPNGCTFVNYLSAGRDGFGEARDVANFLWSDTVTRRTLDTLKVLAVTDPSEALYRAESELPHDHFLGFVRWMTDEDRS